jgi:predicted PurR-regulated permease PerM
MNPETPDEATYAVPEFERKYRNIAFWAIAAVTVVAAAIVVAPFLGAIMWAAVFSVLMWPIYRRCRARFSENVSSGITVMATVALILVPIGLIGLMLYAQISGFAATLRAEAPTGQEPFSVVQVLRSVDWNLRPLTDRLGSDFRLETWYEQNRERIAEGVRGPISQAAFATGYTVFTLVIALLTMFFMLRDGRRLLEPTLQLIPLPREESVAILERMRATIQAVFIGVVLVAVVQGTLAGITYWLVGAPAPVVWGAATVVLCVFPLLGAPVVYVPIALLLFARGDWPQALVLLGVGFGVISLIDNLLRPFVIGARADLHPMAIFFSLLGGVLALGPVGIMAGPALLTLILALVEIVRRRRALTDPAALAA